MEKSHKDSGAEKEMSTFDLDDSQRRAARFLHEKDPTGGLLSTVMFMDSVEDWVVSRLGLTEKDAEEVRVRQRRLSEIITQYREKIPYDNYALMQLLSMMKSSECFYTLDYLSSYQQDFLVEFVGFCEISRADNPNASLALERIHVLFKTRLADRIFSPENFQYVIEAIMSGETA